MKIHCSASFKELLDRLQGYKLVERGMIGIKGKGEMLTYFLVNEEPAWRAKRKIERENRRIETRHGKRAKENGLPVGAPRSSLKNRQAPPQSFSPRSLSRCASFESPKRLRFATNNSVELNPYQRTKLEVITDNSPSKRKPSGGFLETGEFCDHLSASCPCIENVQPRVESERLEANSDPAIFIVDQVNAPLLSDTCV